MNIGLAEAFSRHRLETQVGRRLLLVSETPRPPRGWMWRKKGCPFPIPPAPSYLPPTILVVLEKVCTWVEELENSMDMCSCIICVW